MSSRAATRLRRPRSGRFAFGLAAVIAAALLASVGAFLLLRPETGAQRGPLGPGGPSVDPGLPSAEAAPDLDRPIVEREPAPGESERNARRAQPDAAATRASSALSVPSGDLLVEVVGEDGRPAGDVPVAICLERRDSPFHFLVQRSTADGRVVFRDVAARLQPRTQPGEPGYAVALAIPLGERQLVPFEVSALPTEPLRLVLPATGSLVVRIEESDGGLVQESALVSLGPPGDPEANFRAFESTRSVEGFAHFPRVGLSQDLRVRVVLGGRPPLATLCHGPRAAGEEVVVLLTVDGGFPELVGRAVDGQGRPLSASRGRVHLLYQRGIARVLPLVTLADGSFTVRLFESGAGALERVDFELLGDETGFDAELRAPDVAPKGSTPLGDVIFLPRPLLVSGRVVDGRGDPLPGVSVRVEVAERDEAWRTLPTVTATTDAQGHFRVHASAPRGKARVVARRRGYVTALSEFVGPGSRDLVLILVPGEDPAARSDASIIDGPRGGGR